MVDYVKMASTAQRLIRENGREVIFVRKPQSSLDPNKPWNGPDPIAQEITITLSGVFVPPNQIRQFGLSALGEGTEFRDLIDFSEQVIIVYPGDTDLKDYKTIRDNGINWNMVGLQFLKPGTVPLLAFVGTRR